MDRLKSLVKAKRSWAWHDLLAYETPKRVRIRDPAIGLLRLVALLGAFLYFVVWRLYFDRAYLKREPAVAVIQTSLKEPPSLAPPSSLAYCSGTAKEPALTNLDCRTGDKSWVAAPSTGGEDLFVGTRFAGSGPAGEQTFAFVQNPEAYYIQVAFSLEALSLHRRMPDSPLYVKSIEDVESALVDEEGHEYPKAVRREGRFDTFKVSTLLHAAGVPSLDEPHPANDEVSMRYDGLVVLVTLFCPMDFSGTVEKCFYRARTVPWAVSDASIVLPAGGSEERRGVKFVFKVDAEMGAFDFPTLLVAWVTALALVAIASCVIDTLMRCCLPFKDIYRMLLVESSMSFHDLRGGSKRAAAAVARLRAERAAEAGEAGAKSPTTMTPAGSASTTPRSTPNRATAPPAMTPHLQQPPGGHGWSHPQAFYAHPAGYMPHSGGGLLAVGGGMSPAGQHFPQQHFEQPPSPVAPPAPAHVTDSQQMDGGPMYRQRAPEALSDPNF
mmetsp:Transcript_45867/g.133508  ORF Transcript_45867/g.133508 Transcript_45867/m.133508 type:complete len:496 (-) Transcript_45867:28-1515(-)